MSRPRLRQNKAPGKRISGAFDECLCVAGVLQPLSPVLLHHGFQSRHDSFHFRMVTNT